MSTDWTVPDTLVIRCATGDLRVPCHPSGVPGLVMHPAPGNEDLRTTLWVLAHEPSGRAIAKDFFLLGQGEARLVAAGLSGLTDWTRPVLAFVPYEPVAAAYEHGTAWRRHTPRKIQDLAWYIGDRVIARYLPDPCDGEWHRIEFGWGTTYLRSTVRQEPPAPTVLHFSTHREISRAGRVWSYSEERHGCIDCGRQI